MKRVVGFAAAAVLAIGMIPFAAAGHEYVPVGDTGFAVGLETPSSQGRTCAFVETPDGWHAVGVGAGLYYQTSAGAYDAHNANDSEDDGSMCDADKGHE